MRTTSIASKLSITKDKETQTRDVSELGFNGVTSVKSLIRKIGEAEDRTCDPWIGSPACYPLHYHRFWIQAEMGGGGIGGREGVGVWRGGRGQLAEAKGRRCGISDVCIDRGLQ